MQLAKLFDATSWSRAGWTGIAWAVPGDLPVMALLFTDRDAARSIFAGWQRTLGDVDHRDLLRVAVLEGELPGMPPGYTVHLGLDVASATSQLGAAREVAYDVTDGDVWHRMPNPGSAHLRAFKQAYARAGRYFLMPAHLASGGADFQPDLAIGKTRLTFRQVADVPRTDDPDSAVWRPAR